MQWDFGKLTLQFPDQAWILDDDRIDTGCGGFTGQGEGGRQFIVAQQGIECEVATC